MRRRVLITIAATAALLLVAAVSLAAWLSLEETEPSSFTAASGSIRVDIGNAETVALFNLAEEPNEMTDLSAEYPERVKEMQALAEKRLAEIESNTVPLAE